MVLERGAELELVEEHIGEGPYLSCPVVEVHVAEGAILRHERVQRESPEAFHLGTLKAEVGKGARTTPAPSASAPASPASSPGCAWPRAPRPASMAWLCWMARRWPTPTASCTTPSPTPPATSSTSAIVDGKARAIFNGQIFVAKGAQGTDAQQQSRNLLLSEAARVDTKPQLEIYADDVKCSHGAAVGQLDPEELFYLQSRGMNADDARNLLTYGFAADVLTHIPVASLRRALRQARHGPHPGHLAGRLSDDEHPTIAAPRCRGRPQGLPPALPRPARQAGGLPRQRRERADARPGHRAHGEVPAGSSTPTCTAA